MVRMAQDRDRRWLEKKTLSPLLPSPIFCPPTGILLSPRSLRGVSQYGTGQDTLNTVLFTDVFPQECLEDHEQRNAKESTSCNCAFKEKARQVWRGFLSCHQTQSPRSIFKEWELMERLGNSHTSSLTPSPTSPCPLSPCPALAPPLPAI